MDIEEEEFLKGDSKPCWCCAKNLKTAATLVAIVVLYSHCVVLFILLGFLIFETEAAKPLSSYTNYQVALVVAASVSCVYIPVAFILLIGIVKKKLTLCLIWFWIIFLGTFVDFGILAVDQSLGFIIFACCFFIVRFYLLYVVWAYISVVKKQLKIHGKLGDLSKSIASTTTAVNVTNLVEQLSEIQVKEHGDSIVGEGLDVEELSHDSFYETLKAVEATNQVEK